MKRLLILLLLAASLAHAELTHDEFADEYIAVLEAARDDLGIERVGSLELLVKRPDDSEVRVYLDNAYELYAQDPAGLEDVINMYVSSLLETLAAAEAPLDPNNVVPIIKDTNWLSDMAAAFPEGDKVPSYYQEPLAEGITIFYAVDTPSNISYVDEEALVEAGVNMETIREDAVNNLLARLPDIETHGSEGLYMITADGNFEASLLLVDSIWTSDNFQVKGELVVAVPSRDVLLISGTENTDEFARLKELAEEIFSESPYNVSSNLYVWRNGGWALLR